MKKVWWENRKAYLIGLLIMKFCCLRQNEWLPITNILPLLYDVEINFKEIKNFPYGRLMLKITIAMAEPITNMLAPINCETTSPRTHQSHGFVAASSVARSSVGSCVETEAKPTKAFNKKIENSFIF